MRKVLITVALMLLMATPAFAFDLGGYVGPITFKFGDYTVGREYTYTNGVWVPEGANSGLPGGAQNMLDGVLDPNGDGVEDSWGIIQVTSIHAGESTLDPTIWTDGDSGEHIKGIIYGYDDALIQGLSAVDVRILQVGGGIDLYLGSLPIDYTKDPVNRATDPYHATEGTPFVRLLGVPGIDPVNTMITRSETVDGLTTPFTGKGAGFFKVQDGWGNYDWVLNDNYWDAVYPGADVYAQFVFNSGPPLNQQKLFDAYSNDPAVARSSVIPEPASMALLSLGLLGLARFRRKG